jgi:antitoxin component YwqK of YwqJK toxin-antitoxin module
VARYIDFISLKLFLKEFHMRYLILLISLIFLVSCSSGRPTVHVVDDQVKPINIEPVKEAKSLKEILEHEDYTEVKDDFDIKELGESFNGTVVVKHPNGKIKLVRKLVNGKVVKSESFDENGIISYSTHIKEDLTHLKNYKNGIISTEYISHKNLQIDKEYYDNGELDYIIVYMEGGKICCQDFENGNLLEEYYYHISKGELILNGTYTKFYPKGGSIRLEGYYKNGKKDGVFISRNNDGNILDTTVYKDNIPVE